MTLVLQKDSDIMLLQSTSELFGQSSFCLTIVSYNMSSLAPDITTVSGLSPLNRDMIPLPNRVKPSRSSPAPPVYGGSETFDPYPYAVLTDI